MDRVKPRRRRALILLLVVLLPISFIGALYFGGIYIIENLIIATIVYKLFWKRDYYTPGTMCSQPLNVRVIITKCKLATYDHN